MTLPDAIRTHRPELRSWRVVLAAVAASIAAAVGGQLIGQPSAGRVLAVALIPLVLQSKPRRALPWRPGFDALQALAAGLILATACQLVLAPVLLEGGATTGSDVAEWFWTLHSVRNPGWQHFSANRYPLPSLLAHVFAFTGNSHDSWYAAAVTSMVVTGAGVWLWGTAVAGRGAGWAAALMIAAFPDLVVMARTITGYPEMIAVWTLATGLAAYALRHPHPATCLLAGLGCGASFAVDARGLIPGAPVTALTVVAALAATGRWYRRWVCLGLVVLPLYGSWLVHNQLPVNPRPLEGLVATSVHVSYQRTGDEAPWDLGVSEGWVWGRSMFWEIPETVRSLREAQGRLNPAVASSDEQKGAVERNVLPIAGPLLCLGLLALASCARPPRPGAHGWSARLPRPDWRSLLALLPIAAHVAWFRNTVQYEYYGRYLALAIPGLALLAGLGLTVFLGRRRPAWQAVVSVLLVLLLIPGTLNLRAPWRHRGAAQKELQQCLAAARGEVEPPTWQSDASENALFECYKAQSTPLSWGPRWPW